MPVPAQRGAAASERAARPSRCCWRPGDLGVQRFTALSLRPRATLPERSCGRNAVGLFCDARGLAKPRPPPRVVHQRPSLGNHAPAKLRTASSPSPRASPRAPVRVLSVFRPLVACAACTEAREPLPRPARLLSVGRLEAEGHGQRMRGQRAYPAVARHGGATMRTKDRTSSAGWKPVTAEALGVSIVFLRVFVHLLQTQQLLLNW